MMKTPEFRGDITKQETEQEKSARLILRYIETKIIGKNETAGKEEDEIRKYYSAMSPKEKADALYLKVMAYMIDRQAMRPAMEAEYKERTGRGSGRWMAKEEMIAKKKWSDPYLISEIKVLLEDEGVRRLIPKTYGEARLDERKFQLSRLGNVWEKVIQDIGEKAQRYKQLEQQLHLGKISGRGNVSSVKSRMALLAENLTTLEITKKNLETLRGFPAVPENTDAAANFHYRNLVEYQEQLRRGFVWLPSRKEIHNQIVSAILNHRWPLLIGEAGSGKSDQADAAAEELTGEKPTEIECESTTGEKQLIGDIAIDHETGGSYTEYGPLMRAFTGYNDSRQKDTSFSTGRMARFDESGRLGPKAYSIIKKVRQKAPGDNLYGREVLPGAAAIWTSNPVGPRYPDRKSPDPAMRRELAEIHIDYPPMSSENPELYEFALAALLDENKHISATKEELAPAYEKKDIPVNEREVLEDKSVIIAKDEIIKDMSDARHGALWRFCAAIKSLQDSFTYGNAETEKYPETLLRFMEDAHGNIAVTTDGTGEPLTLSTSTVTLGELASWMRGFNERLQKQDEEFRVKTLTEWLHFKIKTYLKQADRADKGKLEAIFRHFHFLESSAPDISREKPLTPKEIGYLSPRVPRPVYLERPPEVPQQEPAGQAGEKREPPRIYETKQVLLENGERILMNVRELLVPEGAYDLGSKKLVDKHIQTGEPFSLKGEQFSFAGLTEKGRPIGQLAGGEKLYRIFDPKDLDVGVMEYLKTSLDQERNEIKVDLEDFCKSP